MKTFVTILVGIGIGCIACGFLGIERETMIGFGFGLQFTMILGFASFVK